MKFAILIYMMNSFGEVTVDTVRGYDESQIISLYNSIVTSEDYKASKKKNKIEIINLDSIVGNDYISSVTK